MIRSKSAHFNTSSACETCFERAKLLCLVASDRMYTLLLLIAFIRILSPSKAPPVLRFDGSTETMANFLSLKSSKNRLTNSSTKDDFPAPPVPVIPKMGISFLSALLFRSSKSFSN